MSTFTISALSIALLLSTSCLRKKCSKEGWLHLHVKSPNKLFLGSVCSYQLVRQNPFLGTHCQCLQSDISGVLLGGCTIAHGFPRVCVELGLLQRFDSQCTRFREHSFLPIYLSPDSANTHKEHIRQIIQKI